MFSEKIKIFIISLLCIILTPFFGFGQDRVKEDEPDETLEKGIEILKKYFLEDSLWNVANPAVKKNVIGLIHFIEDLPIDSVIDHLEMVTSNNEKLVYRLPENVQDSLKIPGYYPHSQVQKNLEKIGLRLQTEYRQKQVVIPGNLTENLDERLNLIKEGEGIKLFTDSIYKLPDSLKIPEIIPDSLLNSPENFENLRIKDSLRLDYIEEKVRLYNDSLVSQYMDSLRRAIRTREFEKEFSYQERRLQDSVSINNLSVLTAYNDSVVKAVNDSLQIILSILPEYADFIDTTKITMANLTGETTDILLQKYNQRYSRLWLKNEQNDSLSILIKSTDKRGIQMLIDDGVTISRFRPKDTKTYDFEPLQRKISSIQKIGDSYKHEMPWRIGGDGNVGFTQTYLQNWKKGGQSALSILMILKGFANYSRADGKVKWENLVEIRNGWIRPGGEGSELQKNDDKFELTSRYGISAFKKWYYSAEFNYETQFFHGYRYPTSKNPDPISAFMAPAKTFFKLGLDYKPNKTFSLLLSPITLKNVYVRDTALIDQTKYGIPKNDNSFWEPGLNADLKLKKEITEDIAYETKYKMFINYKSPFNKFDINWENTVQMKLNDYINMRFMLHFIYDDDILFPIYDDNGNKTGKEKPKLQFKEFFTIGFVYKINRNIVKAKRIR